MRRLRSVPRLPRCASAVCVCVTLTAVAFGLGLFTVLQVVTVQERVRMMARLREDGHPILAALFAAPTSTPLQSQHQRNRTEEKQWPCMQNFARQQQRHPFTADSWAAPPAHNVFSTLWSEGQPHPVVIATPAVEGRPRVVIVGVAKDVRAAHWRNSIPKLMRLGKTFGDYHLVVYENDSPADSRRALCEELARAGPKTTFLFEDLIHGSNRGRTHNIARARNIVLDWVQTHTKGFDYMLVTDLDGVCGDSDPLRGYDARVLKRAFDRSNEWEAIAFMHDPYWDLWAFRQPEVHPYDHWGPQKKRNPLQTAEAVTDWLKQQPADELITVDSAFMMLAVYKIAAIGSCRYGGWQRPPRGSSRSIASWLGVGAGHRRRHVSAFETCEHNVFNQCIRESNGARIRILAQVYCEGARGWVNRTT